MRVFTTVALLSLLLANEDAVAAPNETVFDLRPSGAVRVPVEINGKGPFTFLLDTGASHSSLSGGVADRLSLSAVAKVRVQTAAGAQLRLVVRLEHMAIGGASASGLMPSIAPAAELEAMEPGIDGVVGQDFLSAFDYTLDYQRRRLRWAAADDGVRLPLIRAGHRSLVRLAGGKGQRPLLMVPDSGTNGLVLFERDGKTAVEVDEAGRLVNVSAVALGATGRGATLRELRVGAMMLRDQPAAVVASEGSSEVEGDGLLPLHHFSSVSFHNSAAYMVVRR